MPSNHKTKNWVTTVKSMRRPMTNRRRGGVTMIGYFSFLSSLLLNLLLIHVRLCSADTVLSTNTGCFNAGETIQVRFTSDNPTRNDWISIVPSSTQLNPFNAQATRDWVYTCGTKDCAATSTTPTTTAVIRLDSSFIGTGLWRVVLVTPGANGAWAAATQSDTFEIKASSNGCDASVVVPPTRAPTPLTMPAQPTMLPTFGGDSSIISTNKQVYNVNENIVISFQNGDPQSNDWIGIFQASTNRLVQGEMWMWTCGGQGSCSNNMLSQGTVVFGAGGVAEGWSQQWPLSVGSYKVFLARNAAQTPYPVITESATFTVVAAPSPTPPPNPAPVAPPTRPPSVRPTRAPTFAPTESAALPDPATISTEKTRYFADEDIIISFQNENPQRGDWIGIYPASGNSNELGNGEMWMWNCGQRNDCPRTLNQGTVVFGAGGVDEAWLQRWPLRGGQYKAYLASNQRQPYPVIAASDVFTVVDLTEMIEAASDDIRDLLQSQPALGPKFVRLGFHDCVGGCDGCVDMRNADNKGLEVPIAALEAITDRHEDLAIGFSRADIWALAALVGADVAQPSFPTVDFSMEFIGRQNCPNPTRGPHRELPHADITTKDLFHFFNSEFGFSVKETVALFGAHTLGVLARENSGFDGPDGWVVDETLLNNNYYFELVGNPDPDIPFDQQVDLAPPWFRDFEDNSDLSGIPDRNLWIAFPEGRDGQKIVMLNADIALVRELTDENMDKETGEVSCGFIGEGRCPHASGSLDFVAEYRINNNLWLNDFQDVFKKMLRKGYQVTQDCFNGVCILA